MIQVPIESPRAVVAVGVEADVLERLVADEVGADVADISVTHRCVMCGSIEHGVPQVSQAVFVSRSRSGSFTAAAVSAVARVGVDIESIDRVARMPVDSVLLHPTEASAKSPRELARLWTAKEAILKLAGVGLAVEPSQLRIELRDDGVELIGWSAELALSAAPELHEFVVTGDVIGAVAIARD